MTFKALIVCKIPQLPLHNREIRRVIVPTRIVSLCGYTLWPVRRALLPITRWAWACKVWFSTNFKKAATPESLLNWLKKDGAKVPDLR